MKKLILVIALLLAPSMVLAQSGIFPNPAWCPTCYVASEAEGPLAGSTVDGSELFWFWGGVCHNGAAPTSVSATAVVNGQATSVTVASAQDSGGGPRADVRAHLQAIGCHGGHAVVVAWFPYGLPTGTTMVSVRLHSQDIYAYHLFNVAAEIPLSDGPQRTNAGPMTLTVEGVYTGGTAIDSAWYQGNRVRITLNAKLREAAKRRLGITSEEPQCRGAEPGPDGVAPAIAICTTVDELIEAWGLKAMQNELRAEMTAIDAERAEKVDKETTPIMDKLRTLGPARCAALAKELGVEVTSLPCGGGSTAADQKERLQ
jgi:hypothetical protein